VAHGPRLYRTECVIDYFGQVMLEIKETGIRIVSRERLGEVHHFSWEYLRKVCLCPKCTAGGQIQVSFSSGPDPAGGSP